MTVASGKPKKTIIFSHLQLSNVGCEIIIRGTIRFLGRALRGYDLRFIVSSYTPERDREIMSDLPHVEVIPMLSWKRYLRAILRQTKRFDRYWSPRFSSGAFARSNLFVSVGGDIYTIFDGRLPDDWMGYEEFATRHRIPSIMFGANMEKFELLSPEERKLLIAHLDRFRLLAVRDRKTESYLATHGVTAPVVVYPDPVFTLRPNTVVRPGKIRRIGLNLSPLAVEKFGAGIVDTYVGIVSELARAGYAFDFIPHVYSSDGDAGLDDRVVLHQIYAKVDPALQGSIRLRDEALGFKKVSSALSEVDLVIAARMHCGLNALTLGKAVYFLEYSVKAKAMLDWATTETPYAAARDAYATVPANALTLAGVKELITRTEALGARHPEGIEVMLEPQLDASPIWGVMEQVRL